MVLAFPLSLFAGFLTKTADEQPGRLGLLSGGVYGLALAVAVSLDPLVAVVFLPAVLANFVAGKIDSKAHALGLIGFLIGLFAFGFPTTIRLEWAALAFAAALADELADLKIAYPRPFLPLAAVFISFLAASFTPILAVLLFDGGYVVAEHVWKKDKNEPKPARAVAKPKKARKKR